jgi:hypothetical protein
MTLASYIDVAAFWLVFLSLGGLLLVASFTTAAPTDQPEPEEPGLTEKDRCG